MPTQPGSTRSPESDSGRIPATLEMTPPPIERRSIGREEALVSFERDVCAAGTPTAPPCAETGPGLSSFSGTLAGDFARDCYAANALCACDETTGREIRLSR